MFLFSFNFTKMFIFALTLHTTIGGVDMKPGKVPFEQGMLVWEISMHHGADPFEVAGFLLAENRGRLYHELEVGRYNGGGEAGPLQLKRVWAVEAEERCNLDIRKGRLARVRGRLVKQKNPVPHHRYGNLKDCLYIGPDQTMVFRIREAREPDEIIYGVYRLSDRTRLYKKTARTNKPKAFLIDLAEQHKAKGEGIIVLQHRAGALIPEKWDGKQRDLFMLEANIEAGVIAFMYQKAKYREMRAQDPDFKLPDWRLLYRCSVGTREMWRNLPLYSKYPKARQAMKSCVYSGRKVLDWEKRIRNQFNQYMEYIEEPEVEPVKVADVQD